MAKDWNIWAAPVWWRGVAISLAAAAGFLCIGLTYIYSAPHFEASDNIPHVGVIKWIAETGTLPVQSAEHDFLYAQEAASRHFIIC